jgi:hypothetical protein
MLPEAVAGVRENKNMRRQLRALIAYPLLHVFDRGLHCEIVVPDKKLMK